MGVDTAALVRPAVMECRPYVAGKPREEVQRLLGIEEVIKLASNENPLGPSPRALEALHREAASVHIYPDDACHVLRQSLSSVWSLPAGQFVVGNGSMQVLELLCKTFVNEGEEVISGWPSFRVFGGLVRAAGGYHVPVPLRDHVHDLEAMLAAITPRTKMLILCNPNNPTGTIVEADALRAFARRIPPGVIFILDEAYAEYATPGTVPDFREILELCPTTIVLRSFSKIYGLAGLRIGYATASSELAECLERARMPFTASRLAQAAAVAALADPAFVARSVANARDGLERLEPALAEVGMRCVPTQANFVAVDLGLDDRAYFEAMMREGVIVFPGSATDMPGYVRVTIGTPSEVERFLEATRRVQRALRQG